MVTKEEALKHMLYILECGQTVLANYCSTLKFINTMVTQVNTKNFKYHFAVNITFTHALDFTADSSRAIGNFNVTNGGYTLAVQLTLVIINLVVDGDNQRRKMEWNI